METAMLIPLQTAVSALTAVAPLFAVLAVGALLGTSIRNMFESLMSEDEGDADPETRGDGGPEPRGDADVEPRGDADVEPRGDVDPETRRDGGGKGHDRQATGKQDRQRGGDGGDGGRGDGLVVELEHRLADLETEVGSLSTTMDTVREENRQIARSVADVEENVRELLDGPGAGVGSHAEVSGNLDAEGEGEGDRNGEPTAEPIDDAVPATEFYEEGVVEETLRIEPDPEDRVGDDAGDHPTGEAMVHQESEQAREEDGDTAGDRNLGGVGRSDKTTFAELKAEYESGDLEWADDATQDAAADEADGESGGRDRGTMPSFADLKEEYESGDLEWVDDEPDDNADRGEEDAGGPGRSVEGRAEGEDKTSFADLKEAYESGDLEWADEADDGTEEYADDEVSERGAAASEAESAARETASTPSHAESHDERLAESDDDPEADDHAETDDESGASGDLEDELDDLDDLDLFDDVIGWDGDEDEDEDVGEDGEDVGDDLDEAGYEHEGEDGPADDETAAVGGDGSDGDGGDVNGKIAEGETGETTDTAEEVDDTATQTGTATTETVTAAGDGEVTGPQTGTGAGTKGSRKPYLEELPEGYWADLVVIEWLEFLVEEVGHRETNRALEYYESIGWIGGDVPDELARYLRGFDEGGDGSLTIDHHQQSLSYINELTEGRTAADVLM